MRSRIADALEGARDVSGHVRVLRESDRVPGPRRAEACQFAGPGTAALVSPGPGIDKGVKTSYRPARVPRGRGGRRRAIAAGRGRRRRTGAPRPGNHERATRQTEAGSEMTSKKLKFFRMETDKRGITVVTFDRPPVNAVSFDVYPDLRDMCEADRVDGRDAGGRAHRAARRPGVVRRRGRAGLPAARSREPHGALRDDQRVPAALLQPGPPRHRRAQQPRGGRRPGARRLLRHAGRLEGRLLRLPRDRPGRAGRRRLLLHAPQHAGRAGSAR